MITTEKKIRVLKNQIKYLTNGLNGNLEPENQKFFDREVSHRAAVRELSISECAYNWLINIGK